MELTKIQLRHLDTIEWLLDLTPLSKGTGRTTLLLYVSIRNSIRNQGQAIPIIDHYSMNEEHLAYYVIKLLQMMTEDKEFYRFKFSFGIKTFRCNGLKERL